MVALLERNVADETSFCHLVPPIILRLAKDPMVSKYNISSLRMINSGAAPLSATLAAEAMQATGIPIKQGYGLTETSPTSNSQTWTNWKNTPGSVGGLGASMIAKVMSEDGKELGVGEDGEIWFKGPGVMQGYLNNEKATQNAITPDGFFKTGDVGHFDENSCLYITDRVKELIKFKGFQVRGSRSFQFLSWLTGNRLPLPNWRDCCSLTPRSLTSVSSASTTKLRRQSCRVPM